MKKTELRKIYAKKRMELCDRDVESLSQKISGNLISLINDYGDKNVHVFLPISKKKEVDLALLIEYCFKNEIKLFVPKIKGNDIISLPIEAGTILKENSLGIQEPDEETGDETELDSVITPLIYCDKFGNRVGYGGGFYDRFFQRINPKAKKIGVSFFPPEEEIEDLYEHDVKLDYLVLPEEKISF